MRTSLTERMKLELFGILLPSLATPSVTKLSCNFNLAESKGKLDRDVD